MKRRFHLSSFQIIILGFAAIILIGALLLLLPISTKTRTATPFNECLFTATSAVCVTGLVVRNTAMHWSGFGQAVILVMIQIGGLGVITIAASFALIFRKKISLMQKTTIQEAFAVQKVGGIVRLTIFIIIASLVIELVGALTMLPVFCTDYGARGIWLAVFHSVSAFCNAGFDIMGAAGAEYASLTSYVNNPVINITIMLLILIGGIGFLTWDDVRTNKWRVKRYRMQTNVILFSTVILILVPALYFFFGEYSTLPAGRRILASLFQAVTPRTAGFNTTSHAEMSGAGQGLTTVLMLIGGAPGSTAGGMKITTFAVLFASAIAAFRRREDAQMFRRRVDPDTVKSAAAILLMYLTLFFTGAVIIFLAEGNLTMGQCLFETASAVGTVGLTLGITPGLGIWSQIVLILLMFIGRVGGLTIFFAALSGSKNVSKYPQEKIAVG